MPSLDRALAHTLATLGRSQRRTVQAPTPALKVSLLDHRNDVERAFNKLKNWRGLATRYDKHALIYRGGMVLASIVL